MLFNLTLPRINPHMRNALVSAVFAEVGAAAPVNGKFLDLTVDLSEEVAHDCPPISSYRLVLRDRVWLRRLNIAVGDMVDVDTEIALFSTEPDEPLDGPATRSVRTAAVSIVPQMAWNTGSF